MGIASFVVGLICLILSPFLNILLILPSILGLSLGIIDFIIRNKRKDSKGFAIAGITLSIIALVICIVVIGIKYFLYDTIAFPVDDYVETTTSETSKTVGIGEKSSLDNIEITLLSINPNFTDYYSYASVDNDYKVIKADFEFKNLGENTEYISNSDFSCYADKFECEAFDSVENAFFYEGIEPEETGTGSVYFEVPKDTKNIQIEFSFIKYDNHKIIFESTFGDGGKKLSR